MSEPRFGADELAFLRAVEEVEIETARSAEAPRHRAIIWVVVDERDRVLVRTFRGPGSRWYREALANPRCRLLAGARALEARAVAADDEELIEAYSRAVQRKYARSRSTPFMLEPHVLSTTLQLLPAGTLSSS